MDKYLDYAELEKYEENGKDFIIRYRNTDSEIAVIAPHGGALNPEHWILLTV